MHRQTIRILTETITAMYRQVLLNKVSSLRKIHHKTRGEITVPLKMIILIETRIMDVTVIRVDHQIPINKTIMIILIARTRDQPTLIPTNKTIIEIRIRGDIRINIFL